VYRTSVLACLALAALTCCSGQKRISRDELQSKLRSAASLAAETSTFLDYVRQNRATHHYAEGHIQYLSSELADTVKELHEALPPTGAETEFIDSRKQVDALAAALGQVRSHIDQTNEFIRDQDQIVVIRNRLQQAISSL